MPFVINAHQNKTKFASFPAVSSYLLLAPAAPETICTGAEYWVSEGGTHVSFTTGHVLINEKGTENFMQTWIDISVSYDMWTSKANRKTLYLQMKQLTYLWYEWWWPQKATSLIGKAQEKRSIHQAKIRFRPKLHGKDARIAFYTTSQKSKNNTKVSKTILPQGKMVKIVNANNDTKEANQKAIKRRQSSGTKKPISSYTWYL